MTDVKTAIRLLADEAERLNATANDESGIVRSLVVTHGLGFNAWFCVCCELADRAAKRQGFDHEVARALAAVKSAIAARG